MLMRRWNVVVLCLFVTPGATTFLNNKAESSSTVEYTCKRSTEEGNKHTKLILIKLMLKIRATLAPLMVEKGGEGGKEGIYIYSSYYICLIRFLITSSYILQPIIPTFILIPKDFVLF